MDIDLTVEEREALQHLLDAALSDMSMEIADTDNAGYRSGLRDRRTVLQSIAAKLARDMPRAEA